MSKMIPLHIADQAVAACEKEIAGLRAVNARLRKAGDAMHAYLGRVDGTTNGQLKVRQDWDNAKEGKQS